MAKTAQRPATYQDLLQVPENLVAEIIEGELFTSPRPSCEVISPHTGRLDRIKKLPIYAREEIPYAWIVDPILRTIEVYRLISARWSLLVTYGGDETVRIEPFDAIEFPLATLWLPEAAPA